MQLTHNNYFTNKNRHLSNSKLGDYLTCPEYFYEKHVEGTVERKLSRALQVGKAVDTWLTEGKQEFKNNFVQKSRRTGDKTGKLTESMWEQVVDICEAVERTSAYQSLQTEGFTAQEIWQLDKDFGLFEGLCGIPDFYKIDGDHCTIVDLKTTRSTIPNKYHYSCLNYGYYRQQALYQILAEKIYDVNEFTSYHLSVNKSDKVPTVAVFELDQDMIDDKKEVVHELIGEIAGMKPEDFKPRDVSWKDAVVIGKKDGDVEWEEGGFKCPEIGCTYETKTQRGVSIHYSHKHK